MPSPLARTRIALDPGRVVRPRATPDSDHPMPSATGWRISRPGG